MARGAVVDLPVRHPIGQQLPAMFLEDSFIQRFCEGLDEVLAPVPAALDNFWALLDPALAPPDFLEWLGGWVGVEIDQTWPIERRRTLVSRAVQLYRHRGTLQGLADLVELYAGVRPEIIEGGGTGWSQTPGTTMPGSPGVAIVVRLRLAQPSPAFLARLDRLVVANKPAHLGHRVEIVAPARSSPAPPPPPTPPAGPPAPRPPFQQG